MRTLSAHALSVFGQSGIEPVILVKIFWNKGNGIIYSDRKFESNGFSGKLIDVGSLDDIVNVNNSSNSAQVSVILDDTDGTLKEIFNTSDIHKTKVQLLQWCSDLAPNEAFVIFTGQISSPIEWKEGDRTLSFEVVTQIEDKEVGFSIEDGKFKLFPSSLIGQAWPIIFGKVVGVPALQILEAPSGILAEGIAIVNDNVWLKELSDLEAQQTIAFNNAREAYLKGIIEAVIAGRYKGQSSGGFNFSFIIADDPQTAESHDLAASSYFAQSQAYTDDAVNIGNQLALKQQLFDLQKTYDKFTFRINTINMPSNVLLQFKLGSATYFGTYNAGFFHVIDRKFPEDFNHKPWVNQINRTETEQGIKTSDIFGNGPQEIEFGQKFLWVDAGTEIHVENFPISFVVSVGAVQVTAVYGYRRGVRIVIPSNYYTIFNKQYGNTVCTLITLGMPLTARTFFNGTNTISEGWDSDRIEVDAVSSIGPNTVDIMTWVISLFTNFTIDGPSFNFVKNKLIKYPMNFALLEKRNVIQFLQELAFQARCSIWLNDQKFYLRYLPFPPVPIDTITDNDIVINSLSVTATSTEDLVTSFTAIWKPNLFQDEDFKIIYKYNIIKYGYKPESYNFYAYNQQALVMKSAEFWMIRKSNTFKILKFKTTLHKLKIETFDAITIDIESGLVANGPVVGTVLKATYNSTEKTIDVEVWLPIRFGEMTVFPFAEPFSISTVYPLLNDPGIKTESPFALAGILPQEQFIIEQHTPFIEYLGVLHPSDGRSEPMGDAFDQPPAPPSGAVGGLWPIDPARIGELNSSNAYIQYKMNPVVAPIISEPQNAGFPGLVKSTNDKEKQTYNVDVYFSGFDNPPKAVVVKQFIINANDEVTPGTPVEVKRLTYRDNLGFIQILLWMQATVWQPANTSEEAGIPVPTGGGGDFSVSGEEDTGSGQSDVTGEGFPPPPPPPEGE